MDAMLIFLDTEFTSLANNHNQRFLISIGCAAQNGSEFYAELTDTYDEDMCSFFVLENVLPFLDGGSSAMSMAEMAAHLKAWIEALTEGEILVKSDAPDFDWLFIEEIFNVHGWPKNLKQKCGNACDFKNRAERFRYDAATADFWRTNKAVGASQHHALWDARCIRFAIDYAHRKRVQKKD